MAPLTRLNQEINSISTNRTMAWIVPCISDFSCNHRSLYEIPPVIPTGMNAAAMNASDLSFSMEDIERFTSKPLSMLGLQNCVRDVTR
jgi:hypothetical protein